MTEAAGNYKIQTTSRRKQPHPQQTTPAEAATTKEKKREIPNVDLKNYVQTLKSL